ncbi:MAG: FKBP-type peptidyl-prolyl cis-trans isomerase [Candidatus Methanolliviera sp. GoM_oil]|nr:MAG: FKBP-type peptidyl-prolyl cis-trans isomerase [Candidatus Methanolliviera sp. GoM_oil]
MKKIPIKNGDTIRVNYTGTFDDGSIFDTLEEHEEPLEFEVGSRMLLEEFENAVIGMEVGEETEIRLKPMEAYGEHDPSLVKDVPRDQIPIEDLSEGVTLLMVSPKEDQIPAQVVKVTDELVVLDMNHPLAGTSLNFKIKVVEIVKEVEE